jgi:hypothetical protein
MKKLVAIATVGLALGFSYTSFATDFMSTYTKPATKNEVRNNIKGGNTERTLMSFYTSPKEANTTTPRISTVQKTDDQYISVFGVRIPSTQRKEA